MCALYFSYISYMFLYVRISYLWFSYIALLFMIFLHVPTCFIYVPMFSYCHEAPRARLYHGLAYVGDFRPPPKDDDDGIPMVMIMGFHDYAIPKTIRVRRDCGYPSLEALFMLVLYVFYTFPTCSYSFVYFHAFSYLILRVSYNLVYVLICSYMFPICFYTFPIVSYSCIWFMMFSCVPMSFYYRFLSV